MDWEWTKRAAEDLVVAVEEIAVEMRTIRRTLERIEAGPDDDEDGPEVPEIVGEFD